MRHAPSEKIVARTSSTARLTTPRIIRTRGVFMIAPAPADAPKAQMESPVHAPKPIRHEAQKPPPSDLGCNPRRIISALTGPGGHATDQPSRKPLSRIEVIATI